MFQPPLKEGVSKTGVPYTARVYTVFHNTVGLKRLTWNRDVNAARNISANFNYFKVHGDVPEVFRRGYKHPDPVPRGCRYQYRRADPASLNNLKWIRSCLAGN